jgi:hypothetical protein
LERSRLKVTRIDLHQRELRAQLLPRLVSRVFHITTVKAFNKILATGSIKPNTDGNFEFTFDQSRNSFFSRRGCVCVFDLRSATSEQIDDALYKYYFLNPSFVDDEPIYLFLSESCFKNLIPWTHWKEENAFREMVVPYVEAGYPGKIGIGLIDSVLHVKIDNPPSPLAEALRRAWEKG